jgi:crotonobetainyl-CoA:carnitine CoA-transferase CaiB-like acyl-CoA transferase
MIVRSPSQETQALCYLDPSPMEDCMDGLAAALACSAWTAVGGETAALDALTFTGDGELPSAFPVTDVGCAAIAAAGLAVAELVTARGEKFPAITVDRRLASFWLFRSIRPIGWKVPPVWNATAGDYATRDGWIKLHNNQAHHRAASLKVLGAPEEHDAVARAVASWGKTELETAIVAAGGCAAEMRSAAEWAAHPQGQAVAAEPLVQMTERDRGPPLALADVASRPLQGLRVLDLTRVLAGPIGTRFLAGYGADVLRIDPPTWDEPGLVPEVTLGKRCARLDLRAEADRATFEALLAQAHVFVNGYRSDALDRLGYGAAARRRLSPGLIDVCLDAYGWTGPWAARRGFDSLVQLSSGIAEAGMRWRNADKPVSLPVQALDEATGYLIAAAAIRGVTHRLIRGTGLDARLSLARTAKFLNDARGEPAVAPLAPETPADLTPAVEQTSWGPAHRIAPPAVIAGVPMRWDRPACALGIAAARWREGYAAA